MGGSQGEDGEKESKRSKTKYRDSMRLRKKSSQSTKRGKTVERRSERVKTTFLIKKSGQGPQTAPEDASTELSHQQWYHGAMPREIVEELLTEDGDFLVRLTVSKTAETVSKTADGEEGKARKEGEEDVKTNYVLTTRFDGHPKHFIIVQTEKGKFTLKKDEFSSITELVDHYKKRGKSLTPECEAKIKRPVGRPGYLLRSRHLEIGKTIGRGHFGIVCHGTLLEEDGSTEVVIKKTKARMTDEERKEMVAEAMMMLDNAHVNVVECKGIAADTMPISIVMVRCVGDLLSHVRKGPCSFVEKLAWCVDAATGLAYLAERGIIHRDVAARNCLLEAEGSHFNLKIGDFGLARKANKKGEFVAAAGTQPSGIPVKSAAPEVFSGTFSSKSDVFAFGVLMWEVFTNGDKPHSDLSDKNQGKMAETICIRVRKGNALVFPSSVNGRVVELAKRCWAIAPTARPTFPLLRTSLRNLEDEFDKDTQESKPSAT